MSNGKYNIMLNSDSYSSKSELLSRTGKIKMSILRHPTKITIQELSKQIVDGHSVILGELDRKKSPTKGASKIHWNSQQLFALDVDNSLDGDKAKEPYYLSFNRALEICREADCLPALCYSTHSYTKDYERYRLIFAIDEPVTDMESFNRVYYGLYSLFTIRQKNVIDTKCMEQSRIFFPGKEVLYINEDAVLDHHRFDLVVVPDKKKSISKSTVSTSKVSPKTLPKLYLEEEQLLKILTKGADLLKDYINPTLSRADYMSTKGAKCIYNNYIKDTFSTRSKMAVTLGGVRGEASFYHSARLFPLHLLYGYDLNEKFPCILPTHDDHSPSACFEQKSDGTYIYHCYSCKHMGTDKYFDIFNLFSVLFNCTHRESIRKVAKLFGVTFETEYQIQMQRVLTSYLRFMYLPKLEEEVPYLAHVLSKNRGDLYKLLRSVLDEAGINILDKTSTGSEKPLAFLSLARLNERYTTETFKTIDLNLLSRKLHYLSILGLIEFTPDQDVNESIIYESRNRLKKYKYKDGKDRYRRVNLLSVPEYNIQLLHKAEEIAKDLNDRGIHYKHFSRKYVQLHFGKAVADKQYVQESKAADLTEEEKFIEKVSIIIRDQIRTESYTTEKDVLNHRRLRSIKKEHKKRLWKVTLPIVLKDLDIVYTKYSSYYKELYKIKQQALKTLKPGRSKILIKQKDLKE